MPPCSARSTSSLFDGSAETDGRFLLIGGDGHDDADRRRRRRHADRRRRRQLLDGGGGNDVVDYSFAPGPVDVDLDAGIATDNGFGDSDLLSSIENVDRLGLRRHSDRRRMSPTSSRAAPAPTP